MDAQQLIAKLHEKGLKATPQRVAIYEYICSRKDHPTTDQVYHEVRRRYPTISLATVYQTLHLFTNLGLLQELELGDNVSRYDPNTSLHANIICRGCGKIQDYEVESVRELWSRITQDLGFEPTGQRLDIYRCCDECKRAGRC